MQIVSRIPSALRDRRLLLYVAGFELAFFCLYLLAGDVHGSYRNTVCNWDCNWYREIAGRGYDLHPNNAGYANWAFFPLFPLLCSLFMTLTGTRFVTDATFVNFALFFGLVVLGTRYAELRLGVRDRTFAAFVFLAFPFGIYFRLPYTESLYGVLVVLTLLCAYRDRLVLAGVTAGFVCACRPTGILLVLTIAGFAVLPLLRQALSGRGVARLPRLVDVARIAGFAALGCSGLIVYAAFLDIRVGDPLAFSHAMRAWDRHYVNPLTRFAMALGRHDLTTGSFLSFEHRSETYLAVMGLLALLVLAWGVVRRAYLEVVFLLATLLLGSSTSLESLPRYIFCNPLSIGLIASAVERLPLPLRWSTTAFFAATQVLLVLAWFNLSAFMT